MAIDGMALALRLRERWPTTLLNQTHPKVLIPTLGGERYADASPEAAIAWFGKHSGLDVSGVWNGHELDTLLSAWAIRQGLEQGWIGLVGDDPALLRPAGQVRYLWPEAHHGVPNLGIKNKPAPKRTSMPAIEDRATRRPS
jgi:hypothetical protein